MADGKGYMIPDEPNPIDDICIRVIVPNDVKYIAAFWGAYQYFTTWKAWQRDAAKTGKICAARWKLSYDIARAVWLSGEYDEDCDMNFDVRQSPVDPCILEKTIDGITWSEFAIINLCDDIIVVPPFPGGDGELPGSDATVEALRRVIIRVNEWRNLGYSVDLVRSLLDAWLGEHAVGNYTQAASNFVDAIFDLPTGDVDTAVDSADWQSVRDEVYCGAGISSVGELLNNGAQAIFDGLNTVSDEIFILLGQTSALLFDGLNSLASVLGGGGMTNLANEWVQDGSQGGVGFGGAACGWAHLFDFTIGKHGWVESDYGYPGSIYYPGVGFGIGEPGRRSVEVDFTLPVGTFIQTVTVNRSVPCPFTSVRVPDAGGATYSNNDASETKNLDIVVPSVFCMLLENFGVEYLGHMTSIVFTGTGTNPF